MELLHFTDIFIPRLVSLYVDGELPIHALVDFDTWKKVYPEGLSSGDINTFHWYQFSLTCNQLKDGTLLFTFILPTAMRHGDPQFAAIRLDPQDKIERKAVYYVMRRPSNIDDQWDIFWIPFPKANDKMELKFCKKVEDTNSLRNFVYAVQQTEFDASDYDRSLKDYFFDFLARARSTQNARHK